MGGVISFSWCGRCAALFSVGLFVCFFVCVFSSFRTFLGSFLALGAWRRAALFSVGLFVCVFVCVFSSFRASVGRRGVWAVSLSVSVLLPHFGGAVSELTHDPPTRP